MKLNNKQANLLAKQVRNELLASSNIEVSATTQNELKKFFQKKKELEEQKRKISDLQNAHDNTFYKIVGKNARCNYYDSFDAVIKKLKESAIPSLDDITDEIILKSMFATEDDMEKFVKSIVAKYNKKITKSALLQ